MWFFACDRLHYLAVALPGPSIYDFRNQHIKNFSQNKRFKLGSPYTIILNVSCSDLLFFLLCSLCLKMLMLIIDIKLLKA